MQYTEHDYPEHAQHENGCYQNQCFGCGVMFIGLKNYGYCKRCSKPKPEHVESGTLDKSV